MRGPPRRSRAAQALRLGWDLARSPALVARHRPELATVRTTCLFVGAPKTGHSLVGALACAAIVFPQPRKARERAAWSAADVRRVEERMGELPFLEGYDAVG